MRTLGVTGSGLFYFLHFLLSALYLCVAGSTWALLGQAACPLSVRASMVSLNG